jgi:hypothetical protein
MNVPNQQLHFLRSFPILLILVEQVAEQARKTMGPAITPRVSVRSSSPNKRRNSDANGYQWTKFWQIAMLDCQTRIGYRHFLRVMQSLRHWKPKFLIDVTIISTIRWKLRFSQLLRARFHIRRIPGVPIHRGMKIQEHIIIIDNTKAIANRRIA